MSESTDMFIFAATNFKVQTREGKLPRITMIADDSLSARVALDFAMAIPRGARIYVQVSIVYHGMFEAIDIPATVDKSKEVESMPLYEYECYACKKIFEELAKPDDSPPACPHCQSTNTVRLPSRISSASGVAPTEKDPEKKPLKQISKEIDEQIRDGEISPSLADAQAKLAGL